MTSGPLICLILGSLCSTISFFVVPILQGSGTRFLAENRVWVKALMRSAGFSLVLFGIFYDLTVQYSDLSKTEAVVRVGVYSALCGTFFGVLFSAHSMMSKKIGEKP